MLTPPPAPPRSVREGSFPSEVACSRQILDGCESEAKRVDMPKNEQPSDLNLDLIHKVQNARLLHDATARPSALAAVYWIEAKRRQGDFPMPTASAGEWRVGLTVRNLDRIWERVKALTVAGKLGYKSKVSTAPAVGQADPDARLLCVRTYDARDQADVARVKVALRAIGLTNLEYVADE